MTTLINLRCHLAVFREILWCYLGKAQF